MTFEVGGVYLVGGRYETCALECGSHRGERSRACHVATDSFAIVLYFRVIDGCCQFAHCDEVG